LDGQRVLREVSRDLRITYDLQPHQKVLREINVRTAEMVRRSVSASFANFNVRTAEMVKRSVSAPLRDLRYHVLRQTSTFAIRDLSHSIAQAFEAQDIASHYSDSWGLYRAPSFRTSAQRSFPKSSPTFGPIMISPEDREAPFDYHPKLQGWIIPETATNSRVAAIDVEELVNVVFAYALGIAQHHRTRVLLTVVGKHGGTFLIRAAENTAGGTAGGLLVYWLLNR
jgi:hypothetical protein